MDGDDIHALYRLRFTQLCTEIEYTKKVGFTPKDVKSFGGSSGLWRAWSKFYYEAGRPWISHIIDHRTIPQGQAKSIEIAARLFSKTYGRWSGPPDIVKWVETNNERFDLLNKAGSWPERIEGNGVFRHGPFEIHDTVGSSPKDVANAKAVIDLTLKALPNTDIPGFASTAYGTIYLVGQIARKKWAAWYMPAKDAIYLRPKIAGVANAESARIFVHELAHRFWAKKLDPTVKKAWLAHHVAMNYGSKGRFPEVGEVLPFIVNGKKAKVIMRGHVFLLADPDSGVQIGSVDFNKMYKWMADADKNFKFPTLYAVTDAEEHFCESVSLRAFGRLTGANLEAFDRIVLGTAPSTTNVKIAARKKAPKRGDCYEAAGRHIMDKSMFGEKDTGLVLVHGEVVGQGAIEGTHFGHAWIEDGETVLEVANGNDLKIPKFLYYTMGCIDQVDNIHRYTWKQAAEKIAKYKHWGPWDLKTSSGL